jgi:hypothetical protein
MSSNGSLVILPFTFDGPRERYEPLGKVAELWRLTSKEAGTLAVTLCPLHQAPELSLPQADGSYAARPMHYMYQPFTTTDFLNCGSTPQHTQRNRRL